MHTLTHRVRLPLRASLMGLSAAFLIACGPGVEQPANGLDFGEVFNNAAAVEDRVALTNSGSRTETVTSIAWASGTAFRLADPVLPIALDAGPAYGFTFAFQPPEEGYQQWDDTATLTIESGNTTYQVQVSMTGLFTNGDFDGDGHVDADLGCEGCDDCNDADATVYPGAEEICDGQDNTCDGNLGALEVDADGDNFLICEGDCNDNNVAQNPSVAEQCDGLDNDCDGQLSTDEIDTDNDGYDGCAGDCEEGETSVNPGASEICDGFDTDCSNDGAIPEDELDGDNDGWFACNGECDDANAAANPGQTTELCDGFDTDCDGSPLVDEGDVDGDGVFACNGDCDDGQPLSFPGNPEVCDFIDNDCDGVVPANEVDGDGDLSPDCVDCDDANSAIYPGAPDVCDGIDDNDCDSIADPSEVDDDSDGFSDCDGDCDDTDAATNPSAAEVCDGVDNDCSGAPLATETFDSDGDGDLDCIDADCPFWVDDDATGGAPVGTQADPFASIDDAIAAVVAGSVACPTVAVLPGTYAGPVDFGSTDLRLVAEQGPAVTVLDGTGSTDPVVIIDDGQTNAALLQGFTVTNGDSIFVNDYTGHGGGIYVSAAPTIQGNVIEGNTAAFHGGGLYSESGDVVLLDNTFDGNVADFDGGGAYIKDSDGMIEGNFFVGNEADDDAGALFLGLESLAEVRWNVFAENEASGVMDANGLGWGGAILNHADSDTNIHNNLFVGNIATSGGAMYVFSSSPDVTNNSMFDNHATTAGEPAGVRIFQGEFSNNVIAGGTGVGVRIVGAGAGATFEYNNVWDFTDGAYYDDPNVAGDGVLTGTDGNIEVNPLFVTATADFVWNDDLTLQTTSLLIDGGDPSALENDADGSRNDMGAFGGPDADWTP
ncbi:MAG: hypothetical protein KDA24_24400 [Deltaproteobacteria bacterium]|nr:hypothetical protein [Deltaproteobacteria bacterium]